VFGDGSAVIYSTPGHTPGHQSMLVRLRVFGAVILSGDVAHSWDNFCCRRVSRLNADKEKSKQSMAKLERIAQIEEAKIWFNHDFEQIRRYPMLRNGSNDFK
jgi:N-acyl homoserine lactone hydrolase